MTTPGKGHDAVTAIARDAYAKLVAFLAAETRDVAAAEDALADAFQQALKHWPEDGVPANPHGWLIGVARRRLIDQGRRRRVREAYAAGETIEEAVEAMPETDIPERCLELMFVCAHPAIEAGVRAPLMLQTILSVPVDAIAEAMLRQPATLAQRRVRAKAKIKAAGVPFRTPSKEDRPERLPALLVAIYVAYGAGWENVAHGADPVSGHASEALYLARLLTQLAPEEPEAGGLLALMLHCEARRASRRDTNGAYVPFAEQDAAPWDRALIIEGEVALARTACTHSLGRFQLEAAIQSAISRKVSGLAIDCEAIVRFSDRLASLTGSPVAMVNHGAALLHIDEATLAPQALDFAARDGRIQSYQPYWAVRAQTLRALKQEGVDDANAQAAALTFDPAVAAWLNTKPTPQDRTASGRRIRRSCARDWRGSGS